MNCPECGNELKEGAKFCVECGTPVTEAVYDAPEITEDNQPEADPVTQEVTEPAALETPDTAAETEPEPKAELPAEPEKAEQTEIPAAAEPVKEPVKPAPITSFVTDPRMLLTTAQYFFLAILFQIPVIGLIFLFVWGLGRPKNLSLKRYSLAMLLLRLIEWLLFLVCTVLMLLGLNGLIPGFSIPSGILPFGG